jgi:hypothetical protein
MGILEELKYDRKFVGSWFDGVFSYLVLKSKQLNQEVPVPDVAV